jgi:hypothetical protein
MSKEYLELQLENNELLLNLLEQELLEIEKSCCEECDGKQSRCRRITFKGGPLDGMNSCAESFHSVRGRRDGGFLYMYQRHDDEFDLVLVARR